MDQVHSSSDLSHLIADGTPLWGRDVSNGSCASFCPPTLTFRSTPVNGHLQSRSACQRCTEADIEALKCILIRRCYSPAAARQARALAVVSSTKVFFPFR